MLETSGTIGRAEIEELLANDLPNLNRYTYLFAAAFVLLALTYPIGSMNFTLVLLMALIPFAINRYFRAHYMNTNLKAIARATGGMDTLAVTTDFGPDMVTMDLPNHVPPVRIPYQDLISLARTDSLYCLSTAQHMAVYVFRSQLTADTEAQLLQLLRTKKTQISDEQLEKKLCQK